MSEPTMRARFERLISGPPFELNISRYPVDNEHAWPGDYIAPSVSLAWHTYQAGYNEAVNLCFALGWRTPPTPMRPDREVLRHALTAKQAADDFTDTGELSADFVDTEPARGKA